MEPALKFLENSPTLDQKKNASSRPILPPLTVLLKGSLSLAKVQVDTELKYLFGGVSPAHPKVGIHSGVTDVTL